MSHATSKFSNEHMLVYSNDLDWCSLFFEWFNGLVSEATHMHGQTLSLNIFK